MKAAVKRPAKQNQEGTFGGRMQSARKQAGLTQQELAAATGLPRYWLGRWERNRAVPNEAQYQKLSHLLSFDSGVDFPKPHR